MTEIKANICLDITLAGITLSGVLDGGALPLWRLTLLLLLLTAYPCAMAIPAMKRAASTKAQDGMGRRGHEVSRETNELPMQHQCMDEAHRSVPKREIDWLADHG